MAPTAFFLALALLFSSTPSSLAADPDAESNLVFQLEHSFGAHSWLPRGSATITSRGRRLAAEVSELSFTKDDVAKLAAAAAAGDVYRIRASVAGEAPAVAAVPACQILASIQGDSFSESLTFRLSNDGSLKALDLSTPDSSGTVACVAKRDDVAELDGVLSVRTSARAKLPARAPGVSLARVMADRQEAKKEEAKPEEKGFIAKYWHFLLLGAVVFSNFLPAAGPAPGAAGGAAPAAR